MMRSTTSLGDVFDDCFRQGASENRYGQELGALGREPSVLLGGSPPNGAPSGSSVGRGPGRAAEEGDVARLTPPGLPPPTRGRPELPPRQPILSANAVVEGEEDRAAPPENQNHLNRIEAQGNVDFNLCVPVPKIGCWARDR